VSRAVDDLKPSGEPTGDSEGKQMADAVLQLAVTYRKVIMPLIAATEKRMDLDHSISKRLELLLAKANEPRAPRAHNSGNKKTEG
jgi:hypothetical protein